MNKADRSLSNLEEERIVPWGDPGLFAWHVARYRFVLPFVDGKRVLDVGCGEGYGSALLAEHAERGRRHGLLPAAVRHASASYVRPNLSFVVQDAAALDRSLGPFDVVTCLEVIEHHADQEALLTRSRRS